jgi:Uma2 family endonuclease
VLSKRLTEDDLTGFPRLCPDFVIELLSASDNLTATKVKMQRWIENGAKLAWLVDPYGRKVYVYSPQVAPLTVPDSTVRGTGPAEGFVLDLTRVWRGFRV